jgi:hypothetical protein
VGDIFGENKNDVGTQISISEVRALEKKSDGNIIPFILCTLSSSKKQLWLKVKMVTMCWLVEIKSG